MDVRRNEKIFLKSIFPNEDHLLVWSSYKHGLLDFLYQSHYGKDIEALALPQTSRVIGFDSAYSYAPLVILMSLKGVELLLQGID